MIVLLLLSKFHCHIVITIIKTNIVSYHYYVFLLYIIIQYIVIITNYYFDFFLFLVFLGILMKMFGFF